MSTIRTGHSVPRYLMLVWGEQNVCPIIIIIYIRLFIEIITNLSTARWKNILEL